MSDANNFVIEKTKKTYPEYSDGHFDTQVYNSKYERVAVKIIFADGTIIFKKSGSWIYKDKDYDNLEDMLELLPTSALDAILFNLDQFRRI